MNKHNARLKAQAAKRRATILDMRDAGMKYREIAAQLKISKQRVHQILSKE